MSHRQIMSVLFALMACMFLSSLDQTVVATAIRVIGDDLNGLDQQAWVTTAFLITSTIMVPLYGKLSDQYGRRSLFIFAVSIFILGSLACSFSTSMLMLAAFRAFQGIGAGGLMSLPLAIMGDIMAPRERAKYQGYFPSVFGVSTVVGPLIGGLFSGAHTILWISGWRWIFLVNVPIGLFALFMLITFLHLPTFNEQAKPRVDWWGATAVIVALVPLLLVAEQGRDWGWTSAGSFACYILSAAGIAAFIVIEHAMGEDAIIPLRLFGSHSFSMAQILSVLVGFGMFGAITTIPLYMQIVEGLTPTESGFATIPLVVGLMGSSIAAGLIIARTGRYGWFPKVGAPIVAAGYLLLIWAVGQQFWKMMGAMFVLGLGVGLLMQALVQASQNAVAARDMGVASSSATFFRQTGGTLGTAVLLSVLFAILPTNLTNSMGDQATLSTGLNAALNPKVATAANNRAVMAKMWTPAVTKIKANYTTKLDQATTTIDKQVAAQIRKQVTAAAQKQAAAAEKQAASAAAAKGAGARQAGTTTAASKAQLQKMIDQKVAQLTPAAQQKALQKVAAKQHVTVIDNKLAVDYTNASQRSHVVDQVAPTLAKSIRNGSSSQSSSSNSDTSDTSFLTGADSALTKPFMNGFDASARTVYWVGLGVILLTFILTWFFKVPELRVRSALEERAGQWHEVDDAAPGESA